MQDFGNYIYFIVFGILIISNIISSAKKKKAKQNNKPTTSTSPPSKTWADILRELQGEVIQTPQPQPVPVQSQPAKAKKQKNLTPISSPIVSVIEKTTEESSAFDEIKEENFDWINGIKDMDTLKKAVVFSEILDKKF